MKNFLFMILSFLFFQAFGQKTILIKSWRDPETMVKMGQFNKILVAAFVKDESNRKVVEDDIIKILKSKAIASYQFLGQTAVTLSEEELSEKIKEAGFDGAVVMRLLDMEKELEYIPGTGTYPKYYGSFEPYYGGALSNFRNPNSYTRNKVYSIETNIYSLKENKLIWSGITQSIDPKDLDKMISKIGKTITDEMKRQGFLY